MTLFGGIYFSEPHVLLLLVLLSTLAHLKLTYVHVCFCPFQKEDGMMLRMSGLLTELNHHACSPTGQPLCIFVDPAYPLRIHLQAPYHNAYLTAEQQSFNSSMSTVRAAVEWVFGNISTYFALLDLKKNLKIGLSPVGKLYSISALLRNTLTCLYVNRTSTFFNLNPPTIKEYFQY